MDCAEYRDLVVAHTDGALGAAEVWRADAHLANCARCANLFAVRRRSAAQLRIHPTPADVRRRVLEALAAAARAEQGHQWRRPSGPLVLRLAVAGALAMLALVLAGVWFRPSPAPPLVAAVVADFRAVEAGTLELGFRTDDAQELRAYFLRTANLGFSNSAVDLEVLGYELVGGAVVDLAGKASSLSVYRGTHGLLVCHRFQGAELPLPPGGETIRGETFYTIDGVTVRVHREGDIVCLMASSLPRAAVIKLWTGSI